MMQRHKVFIFIDDIPQFVTSYSIMCMSIHPFNLWFLKWNYYTYDKPWVTKSYIAEHIHCHLEVQANSKKKYPKKPMLFLVSMGKTGLSHDIFFQILTWAWLLRSNDPRCWISEAATSKFCNCSWKFGFSPRKGKVDLCMTNGSKVLIFFDFAIFQILLYSCK